MRKISFLILGLLLSANTVQAVSAHVSGASSLYQIFNAIFYENGDSDRMASDDELIYSSGYLLSEDDSSAFGSPGDVLRIDLTFSNAEYGNELGYMDGDTYNAVMDIADVKKNTIYSQGTTFTIPEQFTFADTVFIGGTQSQRWYADDSLNSSGNKDHFLAFSITEQALLDVCNLNYGTNFSAASDDVWMIAFEDLNLGDADFNDLVAIVSSPENLSHAPIPGSILLLFSGMMAIIAPRIRRRSHP